MKENELIELGKNRAGDFARMKRLLGCVSNQPGREVLRRVKVEKETDRLRITATDGKRLRSDLFDLQAAEGVYDIRAASASQILLTKNKDRLRFPDWRQVLPDENKARSFKGRGSNFIVWAAAALGCRVDPKLLAVGEDEEITLFIQEEQPGLSPLLLKNKNTLHVIMPVRIDEPWVREVDSIRSQAA